MRTNAMTIRAATSADAGAIRRLAAFSNPARVAADAVRRLRRRRYQLLRQNADIGAARALLRRLAPTPLAA
jgi:hypothetical protein